MREDSRSKLLTFVSHCILNQNSVVKGRAVAKGVLKEIIEVFIELGIGIIQLPCPETGYIGLKRFWHTREQYDNIGFREYCHRLAEEAADLALEYERNGYRILAIVGIKRSPSCGVRETTLGWRGGDPRKAGEYRRVKGTGVFMEILKEAFEHRGLKPIMTDIDVSRLSESAAELRNLFESLVH